MMYLVKWSPFTVIGEYKDGDFVQIPKGYDLISSLPVPVYNKDERWNFDKVPWNKVLELYENGDYKAIFALHNDGKWSENHYCCDYYKSIVDKNVMEFREIARINV